MDSRSFPDFTDSETQTAANTSLRYIEFPSFRDFTDSETQAPDNISLLERVHSSPSAVASECNSFKWKVQVIDDVGNIESKLMASRDVWKLQNHRVIVQFDGDSEQPIDDSGGLLGSWLGQLSNDVNLLPINYSDWRLVGSHIKDKAWDVIRLKFWFDDPTRRKTYVIGVLGSRCKDVKLRLWREYKRDDRSETVQNRPKNVPTNQWYHFVHMRFTDKWKKMQDRNTKNRSNHVTPHLCGRKSFARKRQEIIIKTGKTPSRAELFVATRTKPDGSFVSDEAQKRVVELQTLLSQNPSTQVISNVPASLDDEYAQVFGPERSGRVCCVGRGPTPSRLLSRSITIRPEIENLEIAKLKTQNKALQDQLKNMNMFFQKMFGVTTSDQAGVWTGNFAAAFASIPNPTNAHVNEIGDGNNGNHNVEDHGSDQP